VLPQLRSWPARRPASLRSWAVQSEPAPSATISVSEAAGPQVQLVMAELFAQRACPGGKFTTSHAAK